MDRIRLGNFSVGRVGLGTNRISDNERSRIVLNHIAKSGAMYIDTAELYGQSEEIIGQTLAPYQDGLVVGTKGGYSNNNPNLLASGIDKSLRLLKLGQLPLWQLHRVHENYPLEDTMRFIKSQVDAGKIRNVGLSEVSVEQIKATRKILPIVSVQNHYNLDVRQHEDVVDYCTKENIVFMPYFPLSSGGVAEDKNLQSLAAKYSATPVQIAIAWLLKRSPMMLPIPGTLSPEHLEENLAAAQIELSDKDFASLA